MTTARDSHKKHSLAFKLAAFILTSTSIIFIIAFAYNYTHSRDVVMEGVEENARNLTLSTVNKIETVLHGVEKIPHCITTYLENLDYNQDQLLQFLKNIIAGNDDIYGSTVAFEPYAFDSELRHFAPYYYKSGDEVDFMYLGSESYNYFSWDWYLIPKEMDMPIWSEPYFDEGGSKIIMATYSVPFHQMKDGRSIIHGIVTADMSLEWLVNIVSSISLYDSGYAFLISRNGVFVTHPDQSLLMRESIFSAAEGANDSNLRNIGRAMIRGDQGFVPYQSVYLNKKCWLYYAPLPTNGWSIGVVIPEDELFAGLHTLNKRIFTIGITGFALLFVVVVLISGTITRPIRTLAHTTMEIAKGNLDIEVPRLKTRDEVGDLSRSFEDMRVALKEYISDLTETTAAKERIESELKIAHRIQMSFLPKHFPPFPDKIEFEIFANLEPAKEVGGDLYDFFLLDDDHLFISIGDVAGKGVPAALFMAVTKTLMKGVAEKSILPSEILMKVNDELAHDNESSMFVTVFCGILNIKTGEFSFSNAAHNPPVIIRASQNPDWLEIPRGFLLGPMEGSEYFTEKIILHPGDMLFTYTDGVTEAMNQEKQLYSNERLIETISDSKATTAEQLVHEVFASVRDYADNEPQSDDITALSLLYKGASEH